MNMNCVFSFFFKWKGLVSLLLKKYEQIEELTLLKLASFQSRVFCLRNRTPIG